MAHKIVQNWSTEAIGKLVADEFAGGETHVFLHDVSKFPKESESVVYNSAVEEADNKKSYYEENDRPRYGRRYVRNASMLEICEKLAVFETYYSENGETNRIEPLAGLRVAGPRGVVTSAYEPALHTEGAAEQHPPRMISYWDAQPENGKGDKIHILSTTDVLEWSMRSLENRMMLRELEQPQNFTEGGLWRAPIYDKENRVMRYHVLFEGSAASKNKLRVSDSPEITPPTQVEMFFKDALKNGLGETIQMQPGTVLFIDNHRAAHAVEYLANTKRLTYQLALPTLKPQLRPERAKTVSSFLRSRSV